MGGQARQGIETVLRQELHHRVIGNQPAIIGDVIAQQRYAIVAGEEQRALGGFEQATVRIVLRQGR